MEREFDTYFWGPLLVTRAFAPSLRRHGGGVVNVLSLLSREHRPNYGAYSASKAASWAMSNVIRQELAPSDVTVDPTPASPRLLSRGQAASSSSAPGSS